MNRRGTILALLALAVSAASAGVRAQAQARKVARVSVLAQGPFTPQRQRNFEVLRDSLREHGWVEGRNVAVEYHHGDDRPERLAEVAAALAKNPPDVIVAFGGEGTAQVVHRATSSVPIVMIGARDPVKLGLIKSLARPGGNATGVAVPFVELAVKRLELIREMVPNVTRVAVLHRGGTAAELDPLLRAAKALGVQLQLFDARSPDAIEIAFAEMRREKSGALVVMSDAAVLERNLSTITSFAMKNKVPAIYPWRTYLDLADGLISYGPDLPGMNRRAAYFVDRILRGTKPADLPVEFPREFDLVINLKSAAAIGLTIPKTVLLRASEIRR